MAETFSTGKRDELVERHSLGFRRLARFGQKRRRHTQCKNASSHPCTLRLPSIALGELDEKTKIFHRVVPAIPRP